MSVMIIAIVLVAVLVVVLLSLMLLRRSVGQRVQQSVSAMDTPNAESGTDRSKAGQVRQVAEAYSRGEIDEKTIRTAAKVLGISADEASRRLESVAQNSVTRVVRKISKVRSRGRVTDIKSVRTFSV